jgi:hypothetical protein
MAAAVLKPLRLTCACGATFKLRLQIGQGLQRDDGIQVPVRVNPLDTPRLEAWVKKHETHGGISENTE